MEATSVIHPESNVHAHNQGHGGGHHHTETFISKYIFSLDHKTIGKQFLTLGMLWAIIGGGMSVLFRVGWAGPMKHFYSGKSFCGLVYRWKIKPGSLLCADNHAWHHYGVFCVNGKFERYICECFNSIANRCQGYGLSFNECFIILVFLYSRSYHVCFPFPSNRGHICRMDDLSAGPCITANISRIR